MAHEVFGFVGHSRDGMRSVLVSATLMALSPT